MTKKDLGNSFLLSFDLTTVIQLFIRFTLGITLTAAVSAADPTVHSQQLTYRVSCSFNFFFESLILFHQKRDIGRSKRA